MTWTERLCQGKILAAILLIFGRDPMNTLAALVLSALLARQEAVELKSVRFTELARTVRALQGKVVIVDVWHRT